jgi:hypothetical protein
MDTRITEASELFVVSAGWIDPKQERSYIEGNVATVGLLGLVEPAHQRLQRAVQTESISSKEIDEARDAADSLDDEYDDLYRGSYYYVTSQAFFHRDRHGEFMALREYLFPDDLAGINKSYSAESGEAGLLQQRLTDEKRAQLSVLQVENGVSLLSKIEKLLQVGAALGLAEKKKQDLLRAQAESAPLTRSELNQIKAEWLATAKTLLGAVKLSTMKEEQKKALSEPFEKLEEKITARARTRAEARKRAEEETKKKLEEEAKKA